MGRRFWIIFSIGVFIAGFLVFVFLIWQPFEKEKSVLDLMAEFPRAEPRKKPTAVKKEEIIPSATWTWEEPKEPEFKPFFEEETGAVEDFEDFLARFNELSKPLAPASPIPVSISAPQEQFFAPQPEAPKPSKELTDEEWFKIAYPEEYIEALAVAEEVMKTNEFLSTDEQFQFKTQSDIIIFLDKMIDFLKIEGVIDEEQEKGFREGVNVILPSLNQQERELYERNRIMGIFKELFAIVKTAYGQEVNIGVECYRMMPGGALGFNGWAPCCNCGWTWFRHHHRWRLRAMDDCGPFGTGCDIQFGCLNLFCNFRPAIWDPTNGICGCG